MFITVAICTRNRAELLCRAMDTIVALTIPAGVEWELIVIDNGSTDNTAEVLAGYKDRLPIRRVYEPVAGLSNARNRAVVEARGDYICWTDDDVLLDRGWLLKYHEAFARFPEIAYFGGPIDRRLITSGTTNAKKARPGPCLNFNCKQPNFMGPYCPPGVRNFL